MTLPFPAVSMRRCPFGVATATRRKTNAGHTEISTLPPAILCRVIFFQLTHSRCRTGTRRKGRKVWHPRSNTPRVREIPNKGFW